MMALITDYSNVCVSLLSSLVIIFISRGALHEAAHLLFTTLDPGPSAMLGT